MWKVMSTIIAVVAASGFLGRADAQAPPGLPRAAGTSGPTVQGQEVEGAITRIDRDRRTITLDNGSEYVILDSVHPGGISLTEGTRVKLRYDVDSGRNAATSLVVTP
jgi:outer membrane lipoprotein SlyB